MTPQYAARRKRDGAWLWAPAYADPHVAASWSTAPYLFLTPEGARTSAEHARPRPPHGQPPEPFEVVEVELTVGRTVVP